MTTQIKPKGLLIPIFICTVASLFYVYDFILRVMPEAMINVLMRDFRINAAGIGVLASLFFWGYAPMQIPCGMLYDRFSARKILTITVFFSALAALGFAYTQSFMLASFYRFVMGFMTSFAFVGALVVGATWFRGQYFAFYTGLVQFLGCIGAIIGITPVAVLTDRLGWRSASLWIAVAGFALTLLVWLFVRDAPPTPISEEVTVHPSKSYRHAYKMAFTHAQTWWVALYGFAIWAPVTVFATTWGVNYLQEAYHLSKIASGNLVSIIWWTIGFGGPLVGWLSNHLRTRRWPMWVCSFIGTLSALSILFIPSLSKTEITLFLIGYGIGASGLVLAFGLIVDLQPPKAVGAIVGFTNMAVILSGLTLLPAVGFIIERLWNGQVLNGAPIYSHQSYQIALLMLPACFLLAFLTTFLVKETHCEQTHEY